MDVPEGEEVIEPIILGDCTLYLGDCLEVMKQLPDKSVDAVITDPPYGIGFKYSQHDDSPDGYSKWLWSALELSESKATDGSPVFCFQASPNSRMFSSWFPRDYRVFISAKNWVQMRPTEMQYSYDPVIVWWKDGERWSDGTASRDFFVSNTSPSSHVGLNNVIGHPCPRPLDVMNLIVSQWVRHEGVVLDPFMGSGTTGVACVQTGRKFIGCEIDEGYFNIAVKRIKEAQMQPRLL
jgi:site-specific DNA-methyltransferase (adenine-specific)